MKKSNLLLVLAASAFAFVGCTTKTTKSSSVASSIETSQPNSSESSSNGSSTSSTSKESSSKATGNLFKLALEQDYTNMTAEITQSYSNGEEGEFTYEYYYNGYTIVYEESYAEQGGDPYLYYHDYEGKNYLYFTPDTNAPTPRGAWLNKGYRDAELSIEHTYFSMTCLLAHIAPTDVAYDSGVYYVKSKEKIQELNETAFGFAWYNHLSDISFTISDGRITSIVGFDDLNNEKNFVKILLRNPGSTTFDNSKLPTAPNEDNVMEYWEYKGYTGPYVDKYITSITAAVDPKAEKEEGYDAVIDIEGSVKVSATYLPEDANNKTISWRSADEKIAKVTYDKDGNKIIYGVSEGETTIYAYNNENKAGEVVSNAIKVRVKGLPEQHLDGAVYKLTYSSLQDGTIVPENELSDTLPVTITSNKTVVQDGKNSEIWDATNMCVVMNPSVMGEGNSYIQYDFDDQQVSGISFYYGLYYNTGVSNLSWLSSVVIETSNDGENWTTIDIKDEVVGNISVDNLKLMEKSFAPASKVRISLSSSMVGKSVHFAFDKMAFVANDECKAHKDPSAEVKVESISASANKTTIFAGKTASMTALVTPSTATNKSIRWVSSNTKVATVDENGVVTGVSEGTAEIYAVNDASEVTSNKTTITVNAALNVDSKLVGKWIDGNDEELTTIEVNVLSDNTATVIINKVTHTFVLTDLESRYYYFVEEGTDNYLKIKYSSSMNNVADVETVIGTYKYGVNTAATLNKIIALQSISVSADKTSVVEGGTINLTTRLNPTNANTGTALTYQSSNSDIATVSAKGVVTTKAPGTVTITVTAANGVNTSIDLTVTAKTYPTSVVVTGNKTSIEEGEKLQLNATLTPSDVSEKVLTWTSSDDTIASVSSAGLVTAKKEGTVVITATAANGTTKGTYTLTITKSSSGVPETLVGSWTGYSYNSGDLIFTVGANGEATLMDSNDNCETFTYVGLESGEYVFYCEDIGENLTVTVSGDTLTMSEWYGNVYVFEGENEFDRA